MTFFKIPALRISSMYFFLNPAFYASSSLMRDISEESIAPHLDCHLQKIAELIGYFAASFGNS
jgi:hypothetical protein